MMKMRSKNGITLIALIVTIVVLLILAGVTIVTLTGENGLLGKASSAALANKKAQYFEEIKMEANEEQIERSTQLKNEAFITSLANRLNRKDWVNSDSTIKCDEDMNQNEDDYQNSILIITTKEEYEIYIDIDNAKNIVTIRESSFEKASSPCVVTYDSNGGTGTVESQSVKSGFYISARVNTFKRTGYSFIGWSKYSSGKNGQNEDEVYATEAKIQITEDTTLYAIWEQTIVTVSFDANGGTGTMNSIPVGVNISTELPANSFTREGYRFIKWNTELDGSGTDYTATINIAEDINLYAIWEQVDNLYKAITASNYGDSVNYTVDGLTNWKILYKDSSNNVFIILGDCLDKTKIPLGTDLVACNDSSYDYSVNWGSSYTDITTYSGSSSINSGVAQKFMLGWVQTYNSSTNYNIRAIASLMDTSKWSKFVTASLQQKGGECIGSPTADMIASSLKDVYPTNSIRQSNYYGGELAINSTEIGYQFPYVVSSDTSWNDTVRIYQNNNLYCINKTYWVSSPSNYGSGCVCWMREI